MFPNQLTHGKSYPQNVTERIRMMVYVENKHKIASHNQLYAQGKKSYRMKMNHFGDLVRCRGLFLVLYLVLLVKEKSPTNEDEPLR